MSDIVKFPVDQLDLNGIVLTNDQKDRIVLALQGRAVQNPVQEAISLTQNNISNLVTDITNDAYLNITTPSIKTSILQALTRLQTAITNLETHTNIVSGVSLNYTGFPPNFLGRLSIATAYNQLKEGLRKTSDGVCGVEENKSEIYSEIFRSILGYSEKELEIIQTYISNIALKDENDIVNDINTFIINLNDFKTQDNNAFYKAYNFVTRIGLAQALTNANTNDFSKKLFDSVVGTRIFNTEDISQLKLQCQIWGDDSTPPPSDFSENFTEEFALSNIGDLLGISLGGITDGDMLQFISGNLISKSLGELGLNLDHLSNISGASTGSVGQPLVMNATGQYEPQTLSVGGSTTFIGLSDTPGSITALNFVKGNSAGNALEFATLGNSDMPLSVLKSGDSKYISSGGLQFNNGVLSVSNGLSGRHQLYSQSSSGKQFIIPDLDGYAIVAVTSGLGCSEGMGLFVSADGRIEHAFITSGMISGLSDIAESGSYSDLSGAPTNLSDFTNDTGFITGNQSITLSGDVSGSGSTSITVSVLESAVTQYQTSLSITESQISDLGSYYSEGDIILANVGSVSAPGLSFNTKTDCGIFNGNTTSGIGLGSVPSTALVHDGESLIMAQKFSGLFSIVETNSDIFVSIAANQWGVFTGEAGFSNTSTTLPGKITIREASGNGSNGVSLIVPDSLAANYVWTLPTTITTDGVWKSDASGILTCEKVDYTELTSVPSTFPPSNHSTSTITSGTLGILRGGTGTAALPVVTNFTIGSNFATALQGIDNAMAFFLTDFTGLDTGDLDEGSNLYYTDERVDDRVNSLVIGGNNLTVTYDDSGNTLTFDVDALDAADIESGTFADARIAETNISQHLSGTVFPLSPVPGQMFIRTDLQNEMFRWDDTRGKWLGELQTVWFSRSVTATSGYALVSIGGTTLASTRGMDIVNDMTIVGIAARSESVCSADIDWREDNTFIANLTSWSASKEANDFTLDLDVDGDIVKHRRIEISNISSGTLKNIFIQLSYRNRAT